MYRMEPNEAAVLYHLSQSPARLYFKCSQPAAKRAGLFKVVGGTHSDVLIRACCARTTLMWKCSWVTKLSRLSPANLWRRSDGTQLLIGPVCERTFAPTSACPCENAFCGNMATHPTNMRRQQRPSYGLVLRSRAMELVLPFLLSLGNLTGASPKDVCQGLRAKRQSGHMATVR
jgi:hypothetical protein